MKSRNLELYRYAEGIMAAGMLLNPFALLMLILKLSG
jgi:hypothetical protein